jgi:hypothetical protein
LKNNKIFALFSVIVLFSIGLELLPLCLSEINPEIAQANAAIDKAKEDLNSAYIITAAADVLGANTSDLVVQLNNASDFLSNAIAENNSGNYGNAIYLAGNSSSHANLVIIEAQTLKLTAEQAYNNQVLFTIAGSAIGLLLLIVLGLVGWKFLKKWSVKSISSMKPSTEDQ